MASDSNRSPPGDDGDAGDLDRIAAGVVTTLTLLVAFSLLALGVPWFWVAFPVGFGGVLPVAVGLARRYERDRGSPPPEPADDREAALSTLRDRYARGEIDEDEFERRVERLLQTGSVADADEFLDAGRRDRETPPAAGRERTTPAETESDSNR